MLALLPASSMSFSPTLLPLPFCRQTVFPFLLDSAMCDGSLNTQRCTFPMQSPCNPIPQPVSCGSSAGKGFLSTFICVGGRCSPYVTGKHDRQEQAGCADKPLLRVRSVFGVSARARGSQLRALGVPLVKKQTPDPRKEIASSRFPETVFF